MNLKEEIESKLKEIIDPEVGLDLVTLNTIDTLDVDSEGNVKIIFRPTTPFCPLGVQLALSIKKAVKEIEGVKDVDVEIVDFIYAEQTNELLKNQ
ncbi:MAG TPA: metal-sulfur cluster assembly factor [Dictyoglomaceae bacterium]|nr:metal-sulfur cluster assembly factor [Dictyoglomaceae bacterium]HOL39010.1 metal-sulfur cluster assembly factor [Dictyoglomaceae bacterium]HOP94349.1 metal-sulfur cluster assembly factor [Dictyoglomaceae bacterium]HPP15814.1 metal-sulfur cluster assembly factor [Dictyoglomaceae bacterium]HPU42803.1 metal-sulfur cluster assembly factor [Dictyoglomaceae bacterium]